MEFRTLRYFMAIAEEGSVSGAAKRLHITQPTLSRQLSALEDEIGHRLYTRNRTGIELTEEGVILLNRAQELASIMEKTRDDLALHSRDIRGTVYIGAAESKSVGFLTRAMRDVQSRYPDVQFAMHSGTRDDLRTDLVRGFYDVVLECDTAQYIDNPPVNMNYMALPFWETWGVVMRRDDPLAAKASIRPDDLAGRNLILPAQNPRGEQLDPIGRDGYDVLRESRSAGETWLSKTLENARVVGSYCMPLNLRYMITEGFGIAISFVDIITPENDETLCARPLNPDIKTQDGLLWRKTRPNRQTEAFLESLRALLAE